MGPRIYDTNGTGIKQKGTALTGHIQQIFDIQPQKAAAAASTSVNQHEQLLSLQGALHSQRNQDASKSRWKKEKT